MTRLLLALVVACAPAAAPAPAPVQYDYRSPNGAVYHLHGTPWEPADIDAAEFMATYVYQGYVGGTDIELATAISLVTVDVVAEPFPCGDVPVAVGCQHGTWLRVMDEGCPERSSVAHELLHVFDLYLFCRHAPVNHSLRLPWLMVDAVNYGWLCEGGGEL